MLIWSLNLNDFILKYSQMLRFTSSRIRSNGSQIYFVIRVFNNPFSYVLQLWSAVSGDNFFSRIMTHRNSCFYNKHEELKVTSKYLVAC